MHALPGLSHRKNDNIPFFASITLLIMMVWMILLSITLGLTLRFSLDTLQEKIDNSLTATTSALASTDLVRNALITGQSTQELNDYLDEMTRGSSDLDIISIADTRSIRVYHTKKDRIGKTFVGNDEGRALQGESYLSDAVGTMGYQHRSFCPVYDRDSHQILGFVMASTTHERLDQLHNDILATYAKLLFWLTACTLAFSWLLAVYLKRNLRGARPEDLLRTYLTQNDILNTLDEGLVSLDAEGRICFVNDAAQKALGVQADLLMGKPVDELLCGAYGQSFRNFHGSDLPTSRPNLLASSISLPGSDRQVSQVLILKDKTEAFRRAEQLNGTRHIISALRANTHEYMNKLQVISGLLQMNRVQEAQIYINDAAATQAQLITPILQRIHNTNVAALLLGKLNNMREMDIHMTLLANSSLPEHSAYLRTRELVTIIGNLLENAIEAINASPGNQARNIVLQITEDDTGLLISVSDTGTGIEPALLPHIWDQGFSTKASEGRGVGMSLIKSILDRHDGCYEVDSEPGGGTSITLIFSSKAGGGKA